MAATPAALLLFGESDPYLMRYNADQWYRFVTPMFLHAGLGHILANMVAQIIIGSRLENDIGWWRFLILYVLSGIGGILFAVMC